MDQTWTWAKAPLACSLDEYACGHVLAHLGARLGLHIAPERIAKARIGQVGLGRYHTIIAAAARYGTCSMLLAGVDGTRYCTVQL